MQQLATQQVMLAQRIAAGGAPITLIAHAEADGTTAGPIDTTGADFLAMFVAWYTVAPSVSDSYGNTWIPRTNYHETGGIANLQLFDCVPTSVGSGHTFAHTGNLGSLGVLAFSGINASPFDAQTGNTAGGSNIASIQTGSLTPNQNNTLLLSGVAYFESQTTSINSGFTYYNFGGTGVRGAHGWLVQAVAAAINPTWSSSPPPGFGGDVAATIAGYKGA